MARVASCAWLLAKKFPINPVTLFTLLAMPAMPPLRRLGSDFLLPLLLILVMTKTAKIVWRRFGKKMFLLISPGVTKIRRAILIMFCGMKMSGQFWLDTNPITAPYQLLKNQNGFT